MTAVQQRTAAAKFAEDWQGRGYEKGDSHSFWLALLRNVFGVENPEQYISFEDRVVVAPRNSPMLKPLKSIQPSNSFY